MRDAAHARRLLRGADDREPLCLFDFCLECDGAVAVVTTPLERARDLRHPPAYVHASRARRARALGSGDHVDGHARRRLRVVGAPSRREAAVGDGRAAARRRRRRAALRPLLADGACSSSRTTASARSAKAARSSADGNIRWPTGSIPVNTHGGNLSEAYIIGMTHVKEAVEQIRGTAVNQVDGAEVALVTGGPASIPTSARAAGTKRAGDGDEHRERCEAAARGADPPHSRRVHRSRSGRRRREHRLVVPRCTSVRHVPAPAEPRSASMCRTQDVEWVEQTGAARVYSFTIVHHPVLPDFADSVPYVPIVVELPGTNGCRLVGALRDVDIDGREHRHGRRARVARRPRAGETVPTFRPAGAAGS